MIQESTIIRPTRKTAIVVSLLVLIASGVLLFARLGHYALWDDEAITAMTARVVWHTGDTGAKVDAHNYLAYRDGLLLRNLKDRYTPPLQFYLLAPFIGLMGESPLVCRLPFALCGLGTVLLLLRWMWRWNPRPMVWWVAAFLLLTNASFFLFCRQCRYYAPAILCTTAVLYFYAMRAQLRRHSMWLSKSLALLLATQYLNYAAAIVCLVFDYLLWGRHHSRYSARDWLIILIPQLVIGAVVCSIWNPLTAGVIEAGAHTIYGKLLLLWWNWRDLIASQFIILPLLILCPLMFLCRRNLVLLRAPAALVIYVLVLVIFAASRVHNAFNAELRYVAPIIPLCIVIMVLAVWATDGWPLQWQTLVLAVAVLGSMFQPFPLPRAQVFAPTSVLFYHELIHPQQEPYTPTIAWLRNNVRRNQSVLVEPPWMAYPLMFADGGPVYGWQLTGPPAGQFKELPAIQFKGQVPPDWLIAFGPYRKEMHEAIAPLAKRGIHYKLFKTLHVFWQDTYRPERVWRTFTTTPPSPGREIYIYRRQG